MSYRRLFPWKLLMGLAVWQLLATQLQIKGSTRRTCLHSLDERLGAAGGVLRACALLMLSSVSHRGSKLVSLQWSIICVGAEALAYLRKHITISLQVLGDLFLCLFFHPNNDSSRLSWGRHCLLAPGVTGICSLGPLVGLLLRPVSPPSLSTP